jgi:hypothetical protein
VPAKSLDRPPWAAYLTTDAARMEHAKIATSIRSGQRAGGDHAPAADGNNQGPFIPTELRLAAMLRPVI